MNWFKLIFSIYFIVLVFLPCSDADVLSLDSSFVSVHADAHNCTHADSCSPFCTCSCCGLVTASPDLGMAIILQEKILPIKEKGNFLPPVLYPTQYASRLLRPPQA